MSLWRALGFALTGEELDAPEEQAAQASAVVEWLASQGWDAERLAAHRASCMRGQRPWPHPLEASLSATVGMGQMHALLAQVREATGTSGLHAQVRHGQPRPGDERYLQERPPHHGAV